MVKTPMRELTAGGAAAAAFLGVYLPATGLSFAVALGLTALVFGGTWSLLSYRREDKEQIEEILDKRKAEEEAVANSLKEFLDALAKAHACAPDQKVKERLGHIGELLTSIVAFVRKNEHQLEWSKFIALLDKETGAVARFGRRLSAYAEWRSDPLLVEHSYDGLKKMEDEVFVTMESFFEDFVERMVKHRLSDFDIANESFVKVLEFKLGDRSFITKEKAK